jgi:hypothetical protein
VNDEGHFGKRQWVKLWVGEWLDGTTRYEMTGAQRAFFIDLLALAGRSRHPGFIYAGESAGRVIGYPLGFFQALDASGELDVAATLQLFETCGKIRVEATQEAPVKLMRIEVINWGRYQSNLAGQAERARRYRENKATSRDASRNASRLRHAQESRSVTGVEVEVEVEGDKEKPSLSKPAGLDRQVSKPTRRKEPSPAGFNDFWNLYPRKQAKKKAQDAWRKIKADELPAILNGLRTAMQAEQWQRDGGQFVPLPASWLNGRRWEDEALAVAPAPQPPRRKNELDDAGRATYAKFGVTV